MDRLELVAEIDALLERLRRWAEAAPDWPPAQVCRALVRRLMGRAEAIRSRLDAPLVVATLGGTGTGKSALLNALLGEEVVPTGRRRPTTTRPLLICHPGLTPQALGIDPHVVELLQRDLPALAELVLIDCPDPDTTEQWGEVTETENPLTPALSQREREFAGSTLARLRKILPGCDVLLVTATQQKYRSARVAEELAAAAPGARLIFVQTHAAVDDDVRDDWRDVLQGQYAPGRVYWVDSLAALADAQAGRPPQGDFGELRELLTRRLAGTTALRIRRANFLDLVVELLAGCRRRIDAALPAVERIQAAIEGQRARLAGQLAEQMKAELLACRRQWENRLLGQTASRWGLSPFALVLRVFQGLGGVLSGALLWRVRTPAQLALWGAATSARTWQQRRRQRHADRSADRAVAGCFNPTELRAATLVLEGHLFEAGLPREAVRGEVVQVEAERAAGAFVAETAGQLQSLIARLAARHTGWLTRCFYEGLLAVVLVALLYRLARNFFYDSWLAPEPVPVYGVEFYLSAAFWLVLWCLVLIWAISGRLRRGLRRELDQLAASWIGPASTAGLFAAAEQQCRAVEQFREELQHFRQQVDQFRRQSVPPREELGSRR